MGGSSWFAKRFTYFIAAIAVDDFIASRPSSFSPLIEITNQAPSMPSLIPAVILRRIGSVAIRILVSIKCIGDRTLSIIYLQVMSIYKGYNTALSVGIFVY